MMALCPDNSNTENMEETEMNLSLKNDLDDKNNISEKMVIKEEIAIKEESLEDARDLTVKNDNIFKFDSQKEPSDDNHCNLTAQDSSSEKKMSSPIMTKKGNYNRKECSSSSVMLEGLTPQSVEKLRPINMNCKKLFKCSHCPYQATRKYNLQIHLLTHTDEKPFKCSHCSYQASLKRNLQAHLRTHIVEKPFKCIHCPYQTTQKSRLKNHFRKHSGEKPFKCSHCPYQASLKSSLKIHLVKHTGDKPFKCSHCPYQASLKSSLKIHLMKHIGDKPFKCCHCPYQASNKGILQTHLSIHNGKCISHFWVQNAHGGWTLHCQTQQDLYLPALESPLCLGTGVQQKYLGTYPYTSGREQ